MSPGRGGPRGGRFPGHSDGGHAQWLRMGRICREGHPFFVCHSLMQPQDHQQGGAVISLCSSRNGGWERE